MARTGVLGGGSLNPFGGATDDFGAFNVGQSDSQKTVSAQEAAALAFAVTRAQHDNGQMSDAAFEAAQAAYLGQLDPSTQAGATAQYTIAMQQYTDDRNALVQRIQTGMAQPADLVAFDRQSLAGLDPGSTEYMQRQDRLMAAEGNAFQYDERAMLDKLNHGYITNQQMQSWYQEQTGTYGDNYAVMQDISDKFASLQDRIFNDQDNAMVKAFNAGTLSVEGVLAYVAKVQTDDPGSQRARDLANVATDAKMQAVEVSLTGRYDLTREYADLAAFVAGAKAPTGRTSTAKTTRTYLAADGVTWKTVTSTSGKVIPPTKAEQEAWAKQQVQIKQAKARMDEIKKEVATMPGGWVTTDDVLRHLTAEQAATDPQSKLWWDYQHQIEGLNQQKIKDAALAATGVKIAYPDVASEAAGGIRVGSFEAPVGTKAQITAKQNKIKDYQARIDSGTLPPEDVAKLQTAIQSNKDAIARLSKAPVKSSTAAKTSTPAKTGTGTPAATGAGGARPSATTTVRPSVAHGGGPVSTAGSNPASPFQQITGSTVKVVPRSGAMTITTTKSVVPTNMDPKSYETFHTAFINAIKSGAASFKDPTSGASYAIATDPAARLDQMRQLDQTWLNLKEQNARNAVADHGANSSQARAASRAYTNAHDMAVSNIMYILDSASPGSVTKYDNVSQAQLEYAAGLRSDAKVTNKAISTKGGSGASGINLIGKAVELLDVTERYVDLHVKMAQDAFDRGDYDTALMYQQQVNAEIAKVQPKLAAMAAGSLDAADQYGVPKGATGIAADLKRLANFGTELGTHLEPGQKVAQTLLGTDNNPESGILKTVGGNPIVDPKLGGYALKDGIVRVVGADGKVSTKTVPIVGVVNGVPQYKDIGNTVQVQMKIGTKFQPVLAPYTVGVIGTFTDAAGQVHQIMGKIITDPKAPGGYWTESPFQPGVAIPGNPNTPLRFTIPANAKVTAAGQSGVAAGINVPVGTEIYSWTAGNAPARGGRGNQGDSGTQAEYLMYIDPATGNAMVYQNVNGTAQPISLVGPDGQPSGDSKIITNSGWGYDGSSLSGDQRQVLGVHNQYPANVTGAFLGTSTPGQDLYTLTHPKVTPLPTSQQRTTTYQAGSTQVYRPASVGTGALASDEGYRQTVAYNPADLAKLLPPTQPSITTISKPSTSGAPVVNPYTGFTTGTTKATTQTAAGKAADDLVKPKTSAQLAAEAKVTAAATAAAKAAAAKTPLPKITAPPVSTGGKKNPSATI